MDRIDQRNLPLNGQFTSAFDGTGIKIYIVDSGVLSSHSDFGGRVTGGHSVGSVSGSQHNPCNPHGTRVASVAAGTEFGVAKNATIIPVRANAPPPYSPCSNWAFVSQWVSAINWVIGDHTSGPAVMNFSVGVANWIDDITPGSMNDAVKSAKADGIFVVTSAGNDNVDACTQSPANALEIVTVGGTTITDVKSSSSNWGQCVDLYAPGFNVDVADLPSGFTIATGTSFAAPFVSGVGALLLQRFPTDSPDLIANMIVGGGTQYILGGIGYVPENNLLYSSIPAVPESYISGPSTVGVYNYACQWRANVRGGRLPYTYQWTGLISGSYEAVNGPIYSSGTLYLNVSDVLGAAAPQAYFYVTLDQSNPGNPLCQYP